MDNLDLASFSLSSSLESTTRTWRGPRRVINVSTCEIFSIRRSTCVVHECKSSTDLNKTAFRNKLRLYRTFCLLRLCIHPSSTCLLSLRTFCPSALSVNRCIRQEAQADQLVTKHGGFTLGIEGTLLVASISICLRCSGEKDAMSGQYTHTT